MAEGITFAEPVIDDPELLARLPDGLVSKLREGGSLPPGQLLSAAPPYGATVKFVVVPSKGPSTKA